MNDTMTTIDPEQVSTIFEDCLFKEDEDTSEYVVTEGITLNVGFHPGRLEGYKQIVGEMLALLPAEFLSVERGGGGGWSFLNACNDVNGHQWTGLHQTMEQLMLLGVGTEQVQYQLPKDMWSALPGGMPYFSVV